MAGLTSPSPALLLVAAVILAPWGSHVAEGLPDGAPAEACATLAPSAEQHGAGSQITEVPYALNLSSMSDGEDGYAYMPGKSYPSTYVTMLGCIVHAFFFLHAWLCSS